MNKVTSNYNDFNLQANYDKKPLLNKTWDITKKIIVIATCLFVGLAASMSLALTFSWHVALLSIAGFAVGIFLSIYVLNKRYKSKQEVQLAPNLACGSKNNVPKNITEFNHQIQSDFVRSNENKIRQLIEVIEEKGQKKSKLSHQELDTILDLADEANKNISIQYQLNCLKNKLEESFGSERVDEIFQNRSIIPVKFLDKTKILKDETIDYLIRRAKSYYSNLDKLEEIKSRIDAQVFEKIIARFSLDFCSKPINDEMFQLILKTAQVEQSVIALDKLFIQIEIAAKKDLYLNEEYIENFFHIEEKLQDLSNEIREKRRAELQLIINQAYITREINKKGKITTGDEDEVLILESYGLLKEKNTAYFDKDILFIMFKEILSTQIALQNTKAPLKYVQDIVNSCALRNRLKSVGITDELKIEKFKISHAFIKEHKYQLQSTFSEAKLILPQNFPLKNEDSPNLNFLRKFYLEAQKIQMIKVFKSFFRAKGNHFRNDAFTASEFKNELDKFVTKIIERFKNAEKEIINNKFFSNQISFLAKWGRFLKIEFIQGAQDNNEIFGRGVCWGIVERLRLNNQRTEISLQDFIKEIKILPQDRYLQGMHKLALTKEQTVLIPKNILKRENFSCEEEIFTIKGQNGREKSNLKILRSLLKNSLKAAAETSDVANGWMAMTIIMQESGHKVLANINKQSERVWFFDPNIGLLTFEDSHSFAKSLELCSEFICDLIELYYSDFLTLTATGLVPNLAQVNT